MKDLHEGKLDLYNSLHIWKEALIKNLEDTGFQKFMIDYYDSKKNQKPAFNDEIILENLKYLSENHKNSNVYIYGAGKFLEEIFDRFNLSKYNIQGIFDLNPEKLDANTEILIFIALKILINIV
ncbi:MAG: hypothetical protein MZV70_69905 [Desulfobacterales bacterium]|nr:hypothetical protein [Desulfobacterales bacterium]